MSLVNIFHLACVLEELALPSISSDVMLFENNWLCHSSSAEPCIHPKDAHLCLSVSLCFLLQSSQHTKLLVDFFIDNLIDSLNIKLRKLTLRLSLFDDSPFQDLVLDGRRIRLLLY